MEDTIILRQHYIYMFRVDLPENSENLLLEFFEKYEICNWLGKHELGAKTGKPHYQMAIWTEQIKTNKKIVAMRKYWTDRLGKATCAIKSGRKITSLCSYSSKDKGKTITNLSALVLARIPKWKNKTAEKVLWNDQLQEHIKAKDLGSKHSTAFAVSVMEFHKLNNKRPNRSNIQYLMWKHNKLTSHDLLSSWKLIPDINYYEEEEVIDPDHELPEHHQMFDQ